MTEGVQSGSAGMSGDDGSERANATEDLREPLMDAASEGGRPMRVRISLTEIEDGRGSELAATVQKGGIHQSHHNPVSGKDELISLKGGYSLTYKTNGGSSDDGEANVMDTGAEAEDYTSGVDGGKTLTWPFGG